MTTPAQPDTGAGAAPDTGSAPAVAPTDQQPDASATDEVDYQAETEKWKALARKHETTAKANKKALDALQRSAQPADGEPTTEDLQAQLTEHQEAREAAEARAAELAYGNTINRVAGTLNLDAEALLDSGSFRDAVAEELDDDFTDDDLKAAVTKVGKQYAKNPRFAKTVGASRSGGEFNGAPASPASIDQQIAEATKAKNFPLAIALKQHRAALNRQ
jgi:hypothetical protein